MGEGVPTDQLQHNLCDCTDGHCSNHVVASCVCAFRLNPHHKATTAGTFHNVCFSKQLLCYTPITSPSPADSVYFLKQLGTGKPCVTCQDTSHIVTLPTRAVEDRQERRVPATDHRTDSVCIVLLNRSSTRVDFSSLWCLVHFCLTRHQKTSRQQSERSSTNKARPQEVPVAEVVQKHRDDRRPDSACIVLPHDRERMTNERKSESERERERDRKE